MHGLFITGTIPHFLSELESLVELDLSDNSLDGSIPDNLGAKPSIRFLDLHSNELIGLVPRGISASSSLEVVNLKSNFLSGFSEHWYDASSMESSIMRQLQLANNKLQVQYLVWWIILRQDHLPEYFLSAAR